VSASNFLDPQNATLNSGNIVQNLRLTNNVVGVTIFNGTTSIVRNNQITNTPGGFTTGIDIEGGGGNVISGNVIYGVGVGIFCEGNNYAFENTVSNCVIGFDMSGTDKLRFNTTFNCTAPFDGGTLLTSENN
jgi:Periplasmic copper-binding protein (NosD)